MDTSGNLKISLNKLAIFGLIIITLISLAMKESNIASMAVGGIAGFIGQKALREVQEGEIGINKENQQPVESQIQSNSSKESEIQQSEEIVVNTDELSPEGVKEEDIA